MKSPDNPFSKFDTHDIMNIHADRFSKFSKGPITVFSEEYEERKSALLKRHKKSRHTRKIVIATVVIILSVALAACSKPVQEFLVQVYEKFTSYFSTGQTYNIADLSIEFGYLPDGYELMDEVSNVTVYIATYKREGSETDVLKIIIDSSSSRKSNMNNEDVTEQEYVVNGNFCTICRHNDKSEATLFYDAGIATVDISGTLTDDEMIRLIEEITIMENERER